MKTPITTLIVDGDDTLWVCGQYYFGAMKKFADEAAARVGLPSAFCRSMLDAIDGGMTSLPGAFNRDRFPTSFRATSLALDAISGRQADEEAADAAWHIGDSVFSEPYPIYPGVRDALNDLKARGVRLILNTKGPDDVQWRKIHKNHLENVFNAIYVTLTKDVPHYQKIIAEQGLDPFVTAVVGDSMRDDIIAPNSLGFKTILVNAKSPDEWKPKWSYEAKVDGPIDPTFWIKTFDLVGTVPLQLPNDPPQKRDWIHPSIQALPHAPAHYQPM